MGRRRRRMGRRRRRMGARRRLMGRRRRRAARRRLMGARRRLMGRRESMRRTRTLRISKRRQKGRSRGRGRAHQHPTGLQHALRGRLWMPPPRKRSIAAVATAAHRPLLIVRTCCARAGLQCPAASAVPAACRAGCHLVAAPPPPTPPTSPTPPPPRAQRYAMPTRRHAAAQGRAAWASAQLRRCSRRRIGSGAASERPHRPRARHHPAPPAEAPAVRPRRQRGRRRRHLQRGRSGHRRRHRRGMHKPGLHLHLPLHPRGYQRRLAYAAAAPRAAQ